MKHFAGTNELFLIIQAFLVSIVLIETTISAVPALPNDPSSMDAIKLLDKEIEPLDADIAPFKADDTITFQLKHGKKSFIRKTIGKLLGNEKSFTLKRHDAEKSNLLKAMMDNDKSLEFPVIGISPKQFQMAMDYLNYPEMTKLCKWNSKILPDLINIANYLDIPSMLKDSLFKLCEEFPKKSSRELYAIEQSIAEKRLFTPLLFCTNENPPVNWNLGQCAIHNRIELHDTCQLNQNGYSLGSHLSDLYRIKTPTHDCVKFIRKNNLDLVLYSDFKLEYNDLKDFARDAVHLKYLDLNVALDLSNHAMTLNVPLLYESVQNVKNLVELKILCSEQKLDISQFPKMPKLENLFINHCQLDSFLDRHFPELKYLDLSDNQIENIGTLSMPKLRHLNLKNNALSNIDGLFSLKLSELEELDVSHNHLKHVPKIESMPFLKSLTISHNDIKDISKLMKSELSELLVLHLEKNKIETIPKMNWDENMPKLTEMHVSNNQLQNMHDILPDMKKKLFVT